MKVEKRAAFRSRFHFKAGTKRFDSGTGPASWSTSMTTTTASPHTTPPTARIGSPMTTIPEATAKLARPPYDVVTFVPTTSVGIVRSVYFLRQAGCHVVPSVGICEKRQATLLGCCDRLGSTGLRLLLRFSVKFANTVRDCGVFLPCFFLECVHS